MREGFVSRSLPSQGQVFAPEPVSCRPHGVDVNLQTGRWTECAVKYFMEAGGLDREAAEGEGRAGAAASPSQKIETRGREVADHAAAGTVSRPAGRPRPSLFALPAQQPHDLPLPDHVADLLRGTRRPRPPPPLRLLPVEPARFHEVLHRLLEGPAPGLQVHVDADARGPIAAQPQHLPRPATVG